MAAEDPLPGETETAIASRSVRTARPSAVLKEGAQALPSQKPGHQSFLDSERIQREEEHRQSALNAPPSTLSSHISDDEDSEPVAPKVSSKGKKRAYVPETSEEDEDDEEFSGREDAQTNPSPKST